MTMAILHKVVVVVVFIVLIYDVLLPLYVSFCFVLFGVDSFGDNQSSRSFFCIGSSTINLVSKCELKSFNSGRSHGALRDSLLSLRVTGSNFLSKT